MNNSFFIVCLLLLICTNYCFDHKDMGTGKEKTNGGALKSLQEENGIIQAKESANKIPLECCECLCNGNDISIKGKNTRLNARRVKRSGHVGNGQCDRCGQPSGNAIFCDLCVHPRECAHCTNNATTYDRQHNPACAQHAERGNPANNDEREAQSTRQGNIAEAPTTNQNARECVYCGRRAPFNLGNTRIPVCGAHKNNY